MPRSYKAPKNDHLSSALADLVPEKYRGTDRFLDIVTWNIRYFHHHDRTRVRHVAQVLNALNADLIVLEEILEGALDPVAEILEKQGAGYYEIVYGTTGGNQRVAIMYDLDWIRAKDEVVELFGKGQIKVDGKEAFPRLPLRGWFTSLTQEGEPFDFQLVGVHLKSQRGGGQAQRKKAAESLSAWLTKEAPLVDADVIIIGDWNAPPADAVWQPFHELEQQGKARFQDINDADAISHLMYRTKSEIGSRLDLGSVSIAASPELKAPPMPVRWKSLDALLKSNPKASEIKKYIKEISQTVSDHMPVVTRFYSTEQAP